MPWIADCRRARLRLVLQQGVRATVFSASSAALSLPTVDPPGPTPMPEEAAEGRAERVWMRRWKAPETRLLSTPCMGVGWPLGSLQHSTWKGRVAHV